MNNDCESCQRLIATVEPLGLGETAEIEAHTLACPDCRRLSEMMNGLGPALQEEAAAHMPTDLFGRIMQGISADTASVQTPGDMFAVLVVLIGQVLAILLLRMDISAGWANTIPILRQIGASLTLLLARTPAVATALIERIAAVSAGDLTPLAGPIVLCALALCAISGVIPDSEERHHVQ